mmetsp:Transcript_42923/g.100003  ORF Transcript_42923/g.100003 Transcript_42923/m.100003 type:complete len:213 (+) Transcript_42923:67-705(+)
MPRDALLRGMLQQVRRTIKLMSSCLVISCSLLLGFLIIVLATTPVKQRQGLQSLLVIPLALVIMAATATVVCSRRCSCCPSQVQTRPPAPSRERQCQCVWAAAQFATLDAAREQELYRIKLRITSRGLERTKSKPVSSTCEPCKTQTCACCLDDFLPQSRVAVLPCGHVFHEDCIASWSLASRACANTCPSCRASFAYSEKLLNSLILSVRF